MSTFEIPRAMHQGSLVQHLVKQVAPTVHTGPLYLV